MRVTKLVGWIVFIVGVVLGSSTLAAERTYQTVRWAEDWSWVGIDPAAPDPFDVVKNRALGDHWFLTFGGSTRVRAESDNNADLGDGYAESDTLWRARTDLHLEIRHGKNFRWFSEVNAADTFSEDRELRPFDEDDPDVQNFFLELTAGPQSRFPVVVRLGRQEMLFGNERLVSPADWNNARQTFDGLTVTAHTPSTQTVVFATHPVMHEPHDFDSPNDDQVFWGVHSTFHLTDRHALQAYGMVQDDDTEWKGETGEDIGDMTRRTFGVRHVYRRGGLTVESELALQQGHVASDDIGAWMGSANVGYQWRNAPWMPHLSGGLDAASGDSDPMDGDAETFNPLFPEGHAFLGNADLVGRQNVNAARVQLDLHPTPGVVWTTALHRFELDSDWDALYDAWGKPLRRDQSGMSDGDVATELDCAVAWSFATHHRVSAELSFFWSDDFIENTGYGDDVTVGTLGYEFRF